MNLLYVCNSKQVREHQNKPNMTSYFDVESTEHKNFKKSPITPEWVDVVDDLSDKAEAAADAEDKHETDSLPPLIDIDSPEPATKPAIEPIALDSNKQRLLDLCTKHHLTETAKLIPKLNQNRVADLINEYMARFCTDKLETIVIDKVITSPEKKEEPAPSPAPEKKEEPAAQSQEEPAVLPKDSEPVPEKKEESLPKEEPAPSPVPEKKEEPLPKDSIAPEKKEESAPLPAPKSAVSAVNDRKTAMETQGLVIAGTPMEAILLSDSLVHKAEANFKQTHCTLALMAVIKCTYRDVVDIESRFNARDIINVDAIKYLIDLHETSSLPRTIQAVVQVKANHYFVYGVNTLYGLSVVEFFHNYLVKTYPAGEWKNVIEFRDKFRGYDVYAKLPFVKKVKSN